MQRFISIIFLCIFAFDQVSSNCHPRDYGHGSVVCVCSDELKCEGDFKNAIKVEKGTIATYETTKLGERFAPKSDYHFVKEEPTGVQFDGKIQLDPSKKLQTIFGFGGAFTDSTGANIAKLPKDLQVTLMKDYFGPDGIGYRVGRITIGGSDFSTRAYSLDDHENDDTLEKFALQPEDLNWKIPYIKMAQELTNNQVKLFGSAWSSPIWMKTNHQFNHGGFLIGQPGSKYYKLFAQYLVKFLQEYQKQNVSGLWGLTVLNEPTMGYNPNYGFNVLGMNSTLQRDFVKLDLGPALAAAGLGPDKIKLMVFDDNVNQMEAYISTILSDPEAAKYVSGIAFHWYGNGDHNQNAVLDNLVKKFGADKYFYLGTEACTLKAVELGNWDRAEAYAQDIIHDLNHHAIGWVEWNMVLDHKGGPSWVNNNFDGAMAVNTTAGEYMKEPTYYAIGHFSRFILPDSHRIAFDFHQDKEDKNVLLTVVERPDGSRVAVILNRNAHQVKLQFHDPAQGYFAVDVKPNAVATVHWH